MTLFAEYGCETIVGTLEIAYSTDLWDLQGLEGVKKTDALSIVDNKNLRSLSGLELASVNIVAISDNPTLESLDALRTLTALPQGIGVAYNAALPSLAGLEGLVAVGGLFIRANPALTSLAGLGTLEAVNGELHVRENPALSSLHGLNNVKRVDYLAWISENESLTSLDPLHEWPATAVAGPIMIFQNPALPQCEVDAFDAEQTHPDAACPTSPMPGIYECKDNDETGVCE